MNKLTNIFEYVFAKDLKLNDILVSDNDGVIQNETIIKIQKIKEMGVYAPLTESGTMFVDNIYVSCYADTKKHELAHYVFKVYFNARNIYEKIINILNIKNQSSNDHQTGLHWYANLLLNFFPFSSKFLV